MNQYCGRSLCCNTVFCIVTRLSLRMVKRDMRYHSQNTRKGGTLSRKLYVNQFMVQVFHIILNYVRKLFLTGYVIDLIKRTIEMCEKGELSFQKYLNCFLVSMRDLRSRWPSRCIRADLLYSNTIII